MTEPPGGRLRRRSAACCPQERPIQERWISALRHVWLLWVWRRFWRAAWSHHGPTPPHRLPTARARGRRALHGHHRRTDGQRCGRTDLVPVASRRAFAASPLARPPPVGRGTPCTGAYLEPHARARRCRCTARTRHAPIGHRPRRARAPRGTPDKPSTLAPRAHARATWRRSPRRRGAAGGELGGRS